MAENRIIWRRNNIAKLLQINHRTISDYLPASIKQKIDFDQKRVFTEIEVFEVVKHFKSLSTDLELRDFIRSYKG